MKKDVNILEYEIYLKQKAFWMTWFQQENENISIELIYPTDWSKEWWKSLTWIVDHHNIET